MNPAVDLLDTFLPRPIAFHRCLAEISGSITGGVFLSQALYWSRHTTEPDGWFWKTIEEWYEETMISKKQLALVRKILIQKGFLEEKRIGVPARLFYRLKKSIVLDAIIKLAQEKGTSRSDQREHLEVTKGNGMMAPKGTSTYREETTTESKSAARGAEQPVIKDASKGKKSEFVPPSLQEFIAHGRDRGASEQDCRDQFLIWKDAEWCDGNGKKIQKWKGKLTTFQLNAWLPSQRKNGNGNGANGHAHPQKGDDYPILGSMTQQELHERGLLK